MTVTAHRRRLFLRVPSELDQPFCQIGEALLDPPVDRAGWELAVCQALAGRQPGQQREAFVDRSNGPDAERPRRHRIDDVLLEHQVLHVGSRDDDALMPIESLERHRSWSVRRLSAEGVIARAMLHHAMRRTLRRASQRVNGEYPAVEAGGSRASGGAIGGIRNFQTVLRFRRS